MFARTQRLFLRPGWLDDAAALASALSDRAVTRNLAHVPADYGIDEARAFLSRGQSADITCPDLLIFTRTRGAPRLVGGCGLSREEDGSVMLGYWITRPFWGLGFATEAGGAMLGIAAALGHERIVSAHHVDNPASGRVLHKLGFKPTGRVTMRASVGRGEPVASLEYELVDDKPATVDFGMHIYPDQQRAWPLIAA